MSQSCPGVAKLDLIVQQFGITPDFGNRPFQTLSDLFKFRDRLAHGKTTTEEKSYEYRGNPEDDNNPLDPDWLKKFYSDQAVERVLEDTDQIIDLLLTKAGFQPHSHHLIGSGAFKEVSDEEVKPASTPDSGRM